MAGSDQLFIVSYDGLCLVFFSRKPGISLLSSQASINYYSRECLYRHMQTVVLEAIKKYGSDPVLLFWKSFRISMEGIESALNLVRMKCVFDRLLGFLHQIISLNG